MVAISGAFLSPGQVANPALSAILHLLNVRTGWWVDEPPDRPDRPPVAGWRSRWRRAARRLKAWREGRIERFLFHVFHSIGVDREGDRCHLLTDGAHVENLGLKVLLDRRCGLIVASDCSQADGDGLRFGALAEVLRQARVDGILIGPFLGSRAYRHWRTTGRLEEVRGSWPDCRRPGSRGLDLIVPARPPGAKEAEPAPAIAGATGAGPGAAGGVPTAQEHFLFAHIRYPDGSEGLLIYVRPTLTGDEGEDLLRCDPKSSFPEDEPLDQFYSSSQMNKYRLLGRHIGRELIEDREYCRAIARVGRGRSAIGRPGETGERPAPDRDGTCDDCRDAGRCIALFEREYRPAPAHRPSAPGGARERRRRGRGGGGRHRGGRGRSAASPGDPPAAPEEANRSERHRRGAQGRADER